MGTISYDANGLIINGEHKVLLGGEFHYFRTHSSMWEDRIRKMAQGGIHVVTTYIPWNWHEDEEGNLKWDGEQDLGHFLELCEKHGLYTIVKPGPYICAEHLPPHVTGGTDQNYQTEPFSSGPNLRWPPDGIVEERQQLVECLQRNLWSIPRTARELGIHRTTLWRKVRRLNIMRPGSD